MNHNPFVYGNQVSPANFFNRRQPVRWVVGRLLSGGQSTAIAGEPRTGKTSLLCYLAAPEKRAELYGLGGERLLFQYLDMHMLGGQFTPSDFWVQALTSVRTEVVNQNPDSPLNLQYTLCYDNHFGTFTLETLFRLLKQAEWRLVLLLDEFDTLISHPILNSAEFFGGLRSLASRSDGALALVVGSRLPLSQLNARTQEFNPTGSPYFNTRRVWTPALRKAFSTVALAHTAHLLPQREFLTDTFIEGLRDFGPELDDLDAAGLLTRDEQVQGGWRVAPQAMLWWLADELVRAVRRDDVPFEDWLRAQELDNLLTRQEREQLEQTVRGAVQVLEQGATTLVEAFAKGLGENLAGGV